MNLPFEMYMVRHKESGDLVDIGDYLDIDRVGGPFSADTPAGLQACCELITDCEDQNDFEIVKVTVQIDKVICPIADIDKLIENQHKADLKAWPNSPSLGQPWYPNPDDDDHGVEDDFLPDLPAD